MGKNSKTLVKSVASPKAPKGKKNEARKAANEAAAADRLAKLQARQKLANEIRKTTSIVGDDNDVIAEYEEMERNRIDTEYCDFVLGLEVNGLKVGRILTKFIGERMSRSASGVRYLIESFLSRDGRITDDNPKGFNNSDVRKAVDAAFAAAEVAEVKAA